MIKARLIKKIGISAGIILAVFIIGGFVYVYFSDTQPAASSASNKNQGAIYNPIKPPAKPTAKSLEGVAVQSFDSPVAPGGNTTLLINTLPYSTCTISVTMNRLNASDLGLKTEKADDFGVVTWTWVIPQNTPFGTYPVSVTCSYGAKSAVLDEGLAVKQ